jgi:RsiW-degrading membrane proteinase PrsW (M82 family)
LSNIGGGCGSVDRRITLSDETTMPIRVQCSACDKTLKVADKLAGKRIRCPECQAVVKVPAGATPAAQMPGGQSSSTAAGSSTKPASTVSSTEDVPADWLAGGDMSAEAGYAVASHAPEPPASAANFVPPRTHRSSRKTSAVASDSFETAEAPASRRMAPPAGAIARRSEGGWREHLHWVLLAALLPLAISTLFQGPPRAERTQEMFREHPEIAQRLEQAQSEDEFFAALPDQRLPGAHLPHNTWIHWAYAALSATLFFGVFTLAFPNEDAGPPRLFWTGIATGTVGILLLLGFQWVALFTQGFNVRGRGIVVLLFYIVKFIGFSYRAALDPENGFALSFMGFTSGVGLCEELCKALPIVLFLRGSQNVSWKAACVVGLASGVGFGVSEGITYSADSYNGIATGMTYLVRFASCVALHATWAGAVALLMYSNQDYLGEFDWGNAGNFVLHYLSIAMVLHGLYDTLLKKDHELWALAIAAISFGWLAWLVGRQRE